MFNIEILKNIDSKVKEVTAENSKVSSEACEEIKRSNGKIPKKLKNPLDKSKQSC